MDIEAKRLYMSQNVLTISEVTEVLNVSRQMVREYIKKGELTPIKETPNGFLFLKDDVMQFKDKEYYSLLEQRLFKKKEIIGGGVTRKGLEYFRKYLENDCKDINSVRLYFDEYNSLLDGYFTYIGDYADQRLITVKSPLCVIGLKDGREIWFSSFNCGYMGEGPHGSEKILERLGVEKNLIDELFKCDIISYFKENERWTVEKPNNKTQFIRDRLFGKLSNVTGTVFLFNGNLVLLENSKYGMYWDADQSQFINKYIDFIPQPISVSVLTKDEAIKTGHCKIEFGNVVYYQVILKDRSGREIWFQRYIDENRSMKKQKNVLNILESIGFKIKDSEKNWPEQLKMWLNYTLKEDKSTIFEIENSSIYNKK